MFDTPYPVSKKCFKLFWKLVKYNALQLIKKFGMHYKLQIGHWASTIFIFEMNNIQYSKNQNKYCMEKANILMGWHRQSSLTYSFSKKTNTQDEAHLDVAAVGLYAPFEKTFFDINVTHPNCDTNTFKPLDKIYKDHEKEKKDLYEERVLQSVA